MITVYYVFYDQNFMAYIFQKNWKSYCRLHKNLFQNSHVAIYSIQVEE